MDDRVESDIVSEARKARKLARQHTSQWRKDAREDYDFVAGEQWSDDDKQVLKDSLRPIITFNRVGTILDAVSGSEVSNRQEVQFIPREQGDASVNEILTNAAKWVRDNCDAEDEESDSFMDTAICGMGWTETRMDYDEDVEGEVKIDRVDPIEMLWDPSANKRNLSDARWVGREIKMPAEEFEDQWPDKVDECRASDGEDDFEDDGAQEPHLVDPKTFYDDDKKGQQNDGKKYNVFEYQYCKRETVYVVKDDTTQSLKEYSKDEFDKISERAKKLGLEFKHVKQRRKVYYRAFMCGEVELENGPSPCKYSFTYKCITGKRDRNRNVWYGLVRSMKDPQRWANKFFSQILHIINSNAKGGVMAETGGVANVQKFETSWAQPDGIVWTNPGALQKGMIQAKPAAPYPQGVDRMLTFAIESIRDVSGVNLELLGMADREQAGVLEYQRKQAGLTILATLFDSLRRYRKEQGRLLLHFIQEYISDGRLIRITGENGNPQYVPLTKQNDTYKYDVVVDDSPTSPNQKEKTWAILTQMLPIISKLPVPPEMWSEVIAFSPLPESFIQKARKIISTPQQPQTDPAVMAEMQKLQLEKERMQMDMQHQQQQMQLEQQKAAGEMELQKAKLQSEIMLGQEKLRAEIELKRADMAAQLQIKQAGLQNDALIARSKAEQEAEIARDRAETENELAVSKAKQDAKLKRQAAKDKQPPRTQA